MPATRFGGVIKLMLLFAVQIGFIVVFHALGSIEKFAVDFSNLSQWIETTSPEVALVASIRILALAFSYWMLATSILYMIARSFRIPGLLRAMEFATLPGVRKIIDAGLAATIIGGTVFGGAAAVFAKSTDASQLATPAAVTRTLYVPTPAGDGTGPSVSLVNPDATPTSSVPIVSNEVSAPAATKKVVLDSSAPAQTPDAEQAQTPTAGPNFDDQGNYIPTPAETAPEAPEDVNEPKPAETSPSTSSPKVVVPSETDTPTSTPKVTVAPTTAPVTTPGTDTDVDGKQVVRPDETPTETQTDTSSSSTSYTVVSGDNFWKIAKEQVRNSLGREPSNAEVANYWVSLIDANRSTIRSGDPDLIFPGEVFTLPPV